MDASPAQNPFGRYELLQLIAVGGMGEIWLARMRGAANFEKRCVIKKILPHLAREEEFVEKFIDEANIVVQLTHGNIVPVFDMGEQQGEFYIAMEYIPGLDLRSILKTRRAGARTTAIPICVYIAAEVCKGLAYAHRKSDDHGVPLGIIHRDISPSNILISTDGEVKLVDFGIAKASSRSSRSITGRLQGKFGYMSPEQARGAELDARADIFSTGVVLYEMLTGHRPFEGENDLDSLEKVKTHRPPVVSSHRDDIPDPLADIVSKALAKDPAQRFESAEAMLEALMGFLVSTGQHVTPAQLARELDDELSVAGSGRIQALGASFEDVLDVEADRLLAGSAAVTRTGSLSGDQRQLGHKETATLPSNPDNPAASPAGLSGTADSGRENGDPQDDATSGDPVNGYSRRRTVQEFGPVDATEEPDAGVESGAVPVSSSAAPTVTAPTRDDSGRNLWLVGAVILILLLIVVVVVQSADESDAANTDRRTTAESAEGAEATEATEADASATPTEPLDAVNPSAVPEMFGIALEAEPSTVEVTLDDSREAERLNDSFYYLGEAGQLTLGLNADGHRTCTLTVIRAEAAPEVSAEGCQAELVPSDSNPGTWVVRTWLSEVVIERTADAVDTNPEAVESAGDVKETGDNEPRKDRRPRPMELSIVNVVDGARVKVGDQVLQGPPFAVTLEPDGQATTVVVDAPGHLRWKQRVDPASGKRDLTLDPGFENWGTIQLRIADASGPVMATVRVDGQKVQSGKDNIRLKVPPGNHLVAATNDVAGLHGEKEVVVESNGTFRGVIEVEPNR